MDHRGCAEFRELISGFVDGELAPDERTRLTVHLANCADCRDTLETYRLIGTRIRAMPPVPPPDHLIESIFADTIDAQPRRLFIVTSRLGYSLAAVAAVLLIFVVAIYLIVGGYQRGMQPGVSSSTPHNGEMWPAQNPVEITFNKPMNHASVSAALAIIPPGEQQRLTIAWDGNTLIIGQNQTLKPGTSYDILIRGNAQDKYGNTLGGDFRLSFGTTSTVQAMESPTPFPTVALGATSTPAADTPTSVEEPSPTTTNVTAESTVPSSIQPTATTGSPGTGPTATAPAPSATATPADVAETATTEPLPTDTAQPTTEPLPTDTPEVEPTETSAPEPSPTEPEAPTATPTSSPTVAPETPTEVTIPVTGAFGDVYWGDSTIQARLGQPLAEASSTGALQLGFQSGAMYYRADIGTIYVLVQGDQTWSSFLDTSSASDEPQPGPDPTLWIPGGILGHLWRDESSVSDALGYAIDQYPASFSAQVQQFEGGIMVSSPDTIWILYDDLTWEWLGNTGE